MYGDPYAERDCVDLDVWPLISITWQLIALCKDQDRLVTPCGRSTLLSQGGVRRPVQRSIAHLTYDGVDVRQSIKLTGQDRVSHPVLPHTPPK